MLEYATKYSFISPRDQNFSIPYNIIWYIINNPISPSGFLKLQKTCKLFYSKKRIIVVDSKVQYEMNRLFYFASKADNFKCTDLKLGKTQYWLTQLASYHCGLSSISRYIYRCDLTYLYIKNQDLTLAEIDFLLSNQKMKHLCLANVNIRDDDCFPVPVWYIFSKAPNLTTFYYGNKCEIFSTETFKKLNKIKLNKDVHLTISMISDWIDPLVICKFVEKKAARSADFCFVFDIKLPLKLALSVKRATERLTDDWTAGKQKPSVTVLTL